MSKTVMIVEDNELNMKLFHDLLEAHGYHTVGTRNGIEEITCVPKGLADRRLQAHAILGKEQPHGRLFAACLSCSRARRRPGPLAAHLCHQVKLTNATRESHLKG